jgi:serine/threonine protein kinase
VAYDLVMALRGVHAAGLVHGNVTPDTVLVCDDGTALLCGLVVGVAQEALCGGPGAEQPGAGVPGGPWSPVRIRARDARAVIVGGVPERWSPEQIGLPVADAPPGGGPPPAPEVGSEADAWALGVLLYRAVTGESPFPGGEGELRQDTESLFAAVRAGRYGRPVRPVLPPRGAARGSQQPPPELPECGPLGPLVKRLLRVDPKDRPTLPEAAELIRQLLIRAPEPIDQDGLRPVAALLPLDRARRGESRGDSRRDRRGDRRGERHGEVLEHPDFPHHRHAAPRRRPVLLGALLVGGIGLFVLLALVLVVSLSR